jgi:lipoate-protein ligase B
VRPLVASQLGVVPYDAAYALQKACVRARRASDEAADRLLLLEHPTVYTFGRKAQGVLPLLPPAVRDVARVIERGGEATFHNPGQLVAYPIVRMEDDERDIPGFLRAIEQALIETLEAYGIASERRPGATGVWLPSGKKIASVGIAITGWVTYHGLALNVRNDLSGFQAIHPCGFSPDVMTSMERILEGRTPPTDVVARRLAVHLAERLRRALSWEPLPDSLKGWTTPLTNASEDVVAVPQAVEGGSADRRAQ